MTTNVTVTIGRNVGDVPMKRHEWAAFQNDVKDALNSHSVDIVVPANVFLGDGEFEGILEDSAAIIIVAGYVAELTLGAMLADIARRYSQKAIAFSVGNSELIEGI